MKKRNLQRIFATFMATALAVSTAACGKGGEEVTPTDAPKDDTKPTTAPADGGNTTPAPTDEPEDPTAGLWKDANGNVVNLGGAHIIIRDWWSNSETHGEATNDYEEARDEWRDYIQETYNFTIEETAISDWGSAPQDFVDYVTADGDESYYVFVLRNDPAIVSGMSQGLMYDLSTISCLDFTTEQFTRNKTHELYSMGSSIYCMASGFSEARTGVYFNNTVLKDAGIDPESIYDMQANGTWTWDAFDEIMGKCQRDLDSDGINDIFGLTLNESVMTDQAVFSNGGSYVGKDANGYFYNLEDPKTLEALEWVNTMFNKYDMHDPEGAEWDYYKEEWLAGKAAALVDQAYCASKGNLFEATDFEMTFVMFPKGPSYDNYINCWDNNPVAIPGCYDADKAFACAFAWMLYNTPAPGYEDYLDLSNYRAGNMDERACTETITSMMQPQHGTVNYAAVIPNMATGPDLTWGIGGTAVISESVEGIRDTWKSYIDAANGK